MQVYVRGLRVQGSVSTQRTRAAIRGCAPASGAPMHYLCPLLSTEMDLFPEPSNGQALDGKVLQGVPGAVKTTSSIHGLSAILPAL